MRYFYFFCMALFLASCSTTSFYVVRHAEKAPATNMTSDVPLSAEGQQRAESLKNILQNEKIEAVYSTNFNRTRNTVLPLANAKSLPVEHYQPGDTALWNRVREGKTNVLIAGHSNTVDEIINRLAGRRVLPGDLPETQFGDLFIIRKKGKEYRFEQKKF